MKRTTLPLVMIALATSALAAQADDEKKYQAKLEKEFASKISWELDFEKAMKTASAQKKVIVGYFTRSYSP